jgi:CRP-like cAMP-binding protein
MPCPQDISSRPASQRPAQLCRTCSDRCCSLGTAFSPAADHATLLHSLDAVADRTSVPRGHILLAQGDVLTHCLVIESGVVKLTQICGDGEETVVDVLGPGSIAGLREVLAGAAAPSYVTAVTACTVRRISRAQLSRAIGESSELSAALIATLAASQSRALDQIAALKGQDAEHRIIRFLSETCPKPGGEVTMELPVDRATLAWWLGIRPESLSRSFRKLRALGVTSELRWIRIASLERLRAALDDDAPSKIEAA